MSNGAPDPQPRALIWRKQARIAIGALLVIGAVLLILGNSRSAGEPAVDAGAPAEQTAQQPSNLVYVVMGDSLGRGVQPDPERTLKNGYATQLRDDLTSQFGKVGFIEAACGGATTTSFIEGGKACAPDTPIPFKNDDRASGQLAWGVSELRDRAELPTLVTLTIGGNDVAACLQEDVAPLESCLKAAFPVMRRNWEAIATQLADAAGDRAVLSVATMYDPALGALKVQQGRWSKPARAFHRFVVDEMNPAMREVFGSRGWLIADMGDAMFERGPLGPDTAPVRAICALTAACTNLDIHLNDEGYGVLADVFRASTEDDLARAAGSRAAGSDDAER